MYDPQGEYQRGYNNATNGGGWRNDMNYCETSGWNAAKQQAEVQRNQQMMDQQAAQQRQQAAQQQSSSSAWQSSFPTPAPYSSSYAAPASFGPGSGSAMPQYRDLGRGSREHSGKSMHWWVLGFLLGCIYPLWIYGPALLNAPFSPLHLAELRMVASYGFWGGICVAVAVALLRGRFPRAVTLSGDLLAFLYLGIVFVPRFNLHTIEQRIQRTTVSSGATAPWVRHAHRVTPSR